MTEIDTVSTPEQLAIVVHVQSAEGLKNSSILNRPPWAQVRVTMEGRPSDDTPIIKSAAPSWDKKFTFTEVDISSNISFELYDEFLSKQKLGNTTRTVKELLEQQHVVLQLGSGSLQICVRSDTSIRETEASFSGTGKAKGARWRRTVILPKSESGLTVAQSLREIVKSLSTLVEMANGFTRINPNVYATRTFVSSVYHVVETQLDRDANVLSLIGTLEALYSFLLSSLSQNKVSLFEDVIEGILNQTVECMVIVQDYYQYGLSAIKIHTPWMDLGSAMLAFREGLSSLAKWLDTGVQEQTNFVSPRIDTSVQDFAILHMRFNPVSSHLSGDSFCHPGTCRSIIETITEWVFNARRAKSKLFWLHGPAGSGKSVVSRSIARYFHGQKRLGAFIGIDRQDDDLSRMVLTLAFQLSLFDKEIRQHVINASGKYPMALHMKPEAQLREFVILPLKLAAGTLQGPIIIVIDALDECVTSRPHQGQSFVAEFANALSSLPNAVRIVVTSRPESDIANVFYNSSEVRIEELKPENQDIAVFIRGRLDALPKSQVSEGWPSELDVKKLVELSEGYFHLADNACKFIDCAEPEQALRDLVIRNSGLSVNDLYKSALEASCGRDQSESAFKKDYPAILGLILAVKDPLSPKAIDSLLQEENIKSYGLISQLGSVLLCKNEEDPVRVLHDSFRDYLLEGSGLDSPWHITIADHNQKLAERSIQLLDHTFGDEFCHQTIDTPRSRERLDEVQIYAASYWIIHVCEMKTCPDGFGGRLLQWLSKYFLHWLQALSMLEMSRRATGWLEELMSWIQDNVPETDWRVDLCSFIYDASRFAAFFSDTIAEHPALVYLSALPFAPLTSKIYEKFHRDTLPSVLGGYQQGWSPSLRVLKRMDTSTHSLAFSPDGSKIVSTGDSSVQTKVLDKWVESNGPVGLRVWDVMAGAEAVPFQATDGYCYVAFSPDGSKIWSASEKGTVLTLDAETGSVLSSLPWEEWGSNTTGSGGSGQDTASPTSASMLARSENVKNSDAWGLPTKHPSSHKTLDMAQTQPSNVLNPRPDGFVRAAFSSDGSTVVLGTQDGSLYVVDRNRSQGKKPLKKVAPLKDRGGLHRLFRSTDFSPDDSEFAVGSCDGTIYIFSIAGSRIMELKGHTDEVTAIKYTDAGLVSGAEDGTIRIWNLSARIADVVKVRVDNIRAFQPLAISSDGTMVASTSPEGNIQVWHTTTGNELGPSFEDHFNQVSAIAFTNTGTKLASGSFLNPIHIWQVSSGRTSHNKVERHVRPPQYIQFIDDGLRMESGRRDDTKFWNTLTGTQSALNTQNAGTASPLLEANNIPSSLGEAASWSLASRLPPAPPVSLSCSNSGEVSCNGKKVWRLPLELKHRCHATCHSCVAFGMWNCRVLVVHLPFV